MLADEEIRKAMLGELDESIKALQLIGEEIYNEYRLDAGADINTLKEEIFVYTTNIEDCLCYMISCIEDRECRK